MSNVVADLVALIGFKVDKNSAATVHDAIKQIAGKLRALAAVDIVKSIGAGMAHFAEKTADAATELKAQATAAGLSLGKMAEWQYVSQASGTSASQFAIGVSQLEANLRKLAAGQGGKALAATFARVGIDAQKAQQYLVGPDGMDSALKQVADGVQALGKTAEAGAVTSALMGRRAGRGMSADFAGGSARINALQERRRAMGELSEKDVDNLRDFRQSLIDVKTSITQVASTAIAKLAPAMKELADRATAWIVAHRPLIEGVVRKAFSAVVWIAGKLADTIEFLSDHTTVLYGALGALAGLIVGSVVAAITSAISSFAGLGAAAEAAAVPLAPYLAAVTAIAAAVYGIVEAWNAVSDTMDKLDTSHGKEEQDRQAASDAYYAKHGTYKGMPQDGWAKVAAAGWHTPVATDADQARLMGIARPSNTTNTSNTSNTTNAPVTQTNNITINGARDTDEAARATQAAVDTANRRANYALNRR